MGPTNILQKVPKGSKMFPNIPNHFTRLVVSNQIQKGMEPSTQGYWTASLIADITVLTFLGLST